MKNEQKIEIINSKNEEGNERSASLNTAESEQIPTPLKRNRQQVKKRSFLQKITGGVAILICLLLLPILIANLVIIVKGSLNPDEIPTVMGYAPMAVITESMTTSKKDAIRAGDLVVAKKTDVDKLKIGDIIMFKNNKTAVIHRIAGYDEETKSFITKGDANNTEDLDPVPKNNIIGQYMFRVPRVGEYILFSKTPLGMLLCIGIPILLFLGYDFFVKHANRRRKVNHK